MSIELQQFIARYIHSVEQLETLCLLVENPGKSWNESEVFKSIQSSRQSVAANLLYFAKEGFLVTDSPEKHRFSPATAELARLAAGLVQAYREQRVTIIETIYKMPLEPIRQFADAFRLRKDKT